MIKAPSLIGKEVTDPHFHLCRSFLNNVLCSQQNNFPDRRTLNCRQIGGMKGPTPQPLSY